MPKTAIKVAKSQVQEFYGTGRRKQSVARVYLRLNSKDKDFKVNGRKLDEYFLRKSLLVKIREPLKLTQNEETFDILVRTTGGGVAGQADAVKHGLSRALLVYKPELRATLKKAGFLTRDARAKERKKYGQRGARARFQFSKR